MVKPNGRTIIFKAFMAAATCSLVVLASAASEKKVPEEAPPPYTHTWPKIEFGWRIVLGTIMALCGAAFGSVGGAGSAGIFIPMLTLVIGFDAKSSAAVSTCMVVGISVSTTIYNIKKRHPTLDMPMIDYDLATLFQPMLMLGISLGVTLNILLAEWMVTLILILLCLVISTKAFFKGIETWKKETVQKADQRLRSTELEVNTSTNESENKAKVSIIENVHWNKMGVIVCVWIAILALQIFKSHVSNCSTIYWVINFLQIPVAVATSGYEAALLYRGKSVIASRGRERGSNFTAKQLTCHCMIGVFAGTIGGIVGLGGGVILGPLFLTMQVPPQVTSATSMFVVMFSSSLSVVEYYLFKRFPIPYTLYFVGAATIATFVGQHVVKKLVAKLRRESLVIFILAVTFFISAFFIGAEGIVNVVYKIKHHEKMGFDSLCSNDS